MEMSVCESESATAGTGSIATDCCQLPSAH